MTFPAPRVHYCVVALRNGRERRWTGWYYTAKEAYRATEQWTDFPVLESYILELRMEVRHGKGEGD